MLLLLAPPMTTTTSQCARQLARGVLMLFGRPADRIDEADLRSREPLADEPHEVLHPFDRLRGLSRDSDPRMFLEVHDVLFVQHHVEAVEVLSHRPHLHVRALADDHRMIALPHQQRHGAVRQRERADRSPRRRPDRARESVASARWEAPCAVTITLDVFTSARSRAIAIPCASRSSSTIGLCTRSPRMVRGPALPRSTANAIASRTPKHMPRCAARTILVIFAQQ